MHLMFDLICMENGSDTYGNKHAFDQRIIRNARESTIRIEREYSPALEQIIEIYKELRAHRMDRAPRGKWNWWCECVCVCVCMKPFIRTSLRLNVLWPSTRAWQARLHGKHDWSLRVFAIGFCASEIACADGWRLAETIHGA